MHAAQAVKPTSPFLFFILFLPFGAAAGFVQVMIGFLAHRAGIGDGAIAAMVAMNTLPQAWKFFWAPVVDTVWNGRGWYVSANLVSSAAIVAIGLVPMTQGNVGLMSAVILIGGLSTTMVGMCTESLMARLTAPEHRGSAAGWSQAGNVGGSLIGGIALFIAERTSHAWLPAAVVGGALLACSFALLLVEEPVDQAPRPALGASMRELVNDLRSVLGSRNGVLAVSLCLLPIGAGGAQALFSATADQWHTSADMVSFSNGVGGGLAAIAGSLAGGWLSDRMDRRAAYASAGLVIALVAFAMAALPKTAGPYVACVLAYNAGLGLCYATFAGFVLEVIGKGAAATKYNIFASLSNMPIYLMTRIDGEVSERHGRIAMLLVDGGSGVLGAVLLAGVVLALRTRPARAL